MAFTSPDSDSRYFFLDDIINRAIQKAVAGDDTSLKSLIDKPNYLMNIGDIRVRDLANIADLYLKKAEAGDKTDSHIVAEALQRLPDGNEKAALLARYNVLMQ